MFIRFFSDLLIFRDFSKLKHFGHFENEEEMRKAAAVQKAARKFKMLLHKVTYSIERLNLT